MSNQQAITNEEREERRARIVSLERWLTWEEREFGDTLGNDIIQLDRFAAFCGQRNYTEVLANTSSLKPLFDALNGPYGYTIYRARKITQENQQNG